MAFSNRWRYGAQVIPGEVTLNDLYNIIPMNPPFSTVALSGEDFVEMLEENLEQPFARSPYDQIGGSNGVPPKMPLMVHINQREKK